MKFSKRFGAVALGIAIQRTRTVFKFAYDDEMIDVPVRFGPQFKKPSKKRMLQARHAAGPKLIEAADLRKLIETAGVPLKAMILLGINCGFGQSDVAALPINAVDLDGGWANFPRVKTAMPRRIPLWPETVEALRAAIADRPDPRSDADAGLVFLTKFGKAGCG